MRKRVMSVTRPVLERGDAQCFAENVEDGVHGCFSF
jgi:hypothetical protein